MSFASIILALVTLQRLGELVLARHNTERLLARGAIEIGARHYPLVVSVHAAWLIALWAFGRDQDVNLAALALFALLQAMRLWMRGEPLITTGPYRYLSHPNYAVVVAEIALLPLALHLPGVAIVFTLLNAAVLVIRVRAETRALSATGGGLSRANS